ncbi:uncharacterized protein C20orf85-like isoform X1 [Gadus macrocephalus]|uniref:uncharacterized protein C20orf85-like isoform X1 n=1 Tax=Gadus macrocephalus TaxID=80720 RepID=UPI0028CB9112|nr:uncharacterized protein C20orf85-like isoform X1 [Gadus macrocephalus]
MATNVEESKPINFVSQDEIWKTRLKVEKESSKIWPHKWDFLSEVYIEVSCSVSEPEEGGGTEGGGRGAGPPTSSEGTPPDPRRKIHPCKPLPSCTPDNSGFDWLEVFPATSPARGLWQGDPWEAELPEGTGLDTRILHLIG